MLDKLILDDEVKQGLGLYGDVGIAKIMQKLLRYFYRVGRPALAGPAAVDAGISLRQLVILIQVLLDAGALQFVSPAEVPSMGFDHRSIVYSLTPEAKSWLAYVD